MQSVDMSALISACDSLMAEIREMKIDSGIVPAAPIVPRELRSTVRPDRGRFTAHKSRY